jgi:hypothetical protein
MGAHRTPRDSPLRVVQADRFLYLKPFKIKTIHDILNDYGSIDFKSLFDLYLFTGGVPRCIDILMKNSALW